MKNRLIQFIARILYLVGLGGVPTRLLTRYKHRKINSKFGAQINRVQKAENFTNYKFPLFCTLRNEMPRIPYFLEYYRKLGVDHFFFVDNNSDDGFLEYMKMQTDCSVWHTEHSYQASAFGMQWLNVLLNKYGTGHWCITCDPDEFFVYPKVEHRSLLELTEALDSMGQESVYTVMIDAYSDKPISQTYVEPGVSPFSVCKYFDVFNFTQRYDEKKASFWIQGGVRMRKFFKDNPDESPALNKIPLIKWKDTYRYIVSMHDTNTKELNCSVRKEDKFISGAVFHFKYINTLKEKIKEEMVRQEHYKAGAEYKQYSNGVETLLYDEDWSVEYENSDQLVQMKFIHQGDWF